MSDPTIRDASREVTFDFGGRSIHFHLLERCSVSDHIEGERAFYELAFLETLARTLEEGTTVIDVGAHIGNHAIYFAAVLGLRVLAFEPNPDAFEKLTANVEANGVSHLVQCHQLALSDHDSTLAMRRAYESDAGSMSVVDAPGPTDLSVESRRLDSFRGEVTAPVYLKIDVEGHEPAVLAGGGLLIGETSPIVSTEISSIEHFDAISAALGDRYIPVGLYNPTPTVIFRADGVLDEAMQISLVRYGITNTFNYLQRRDWYLNQRNRADQLARSLESRAYDIDSQRMFTDALAATLTQLSRKAPELRLGSVDLGDWARLLERLPDLVDRRALIVTFRAQPVLAALLSMFVGTIDLAEVDESALTLTRYNNGKPTSKPTRHSLRSQGRPGVAALISLFCEEGDESFGPVAATLLFAPEVAAGIAQNVVDLLEAPYVAVAADAAYEYPMLRFWVGASAVYLASTSLRDEWERSHLVPASPINIGDTEAVVTALALAIEGSEHLGEPAPGAEGSHRVLIVSYFAPPTTPVSVQRLKYWHESLPALASARGRDMEVTWLTATRGAGLNDRTVVVPDYGELRVSDESWGFIERLRQLELDRLGASWTDAVERFCQGWDARFDTVIISGNPFYYFQLGGVFKELWGAKVILDFRDPFAWNPRFRYSLDQRAFFMELEREMVSRSDAVISVNLECLAQITVEGQAERRVVANGFSEDVVDEIVSESARGSGPVRIVYTGTVFRNLPLDDVLDALPAGRMVLEHYGRDYSLSQAVRDHPSGAARGLMPYDRLIASISSADAGIVMTSGESSTQTTKLFDYVACDLDIIIITDGELRSGNLHEMTEGLEGVFWVRNDPGELKSFFSAYEPSHVKREQRAKFSRRHQTESLLDLIFELEAS